MTEIPGQKHGRHAAAADLAIDRVAARYRLRQQRREVAGNEEPP
jgi:hypothetical protein